MFIEKNSEGKEKKAGVRFQDSCLPFSISRFLFLYSVENAIGQKKWYIIFLNVHRKKKSEGQMHGEKLLCAENIGKLFMFSPGQEWAWRNHMFTIPRTSVTKSHVNDPFTIPGLATLKPELGENMRNFKWCFHTPLPHDRFFSFQYLIENIIEAYPPTYLFRLDPHYFSIYESERKKKSGKKKKEFAVGGRRTRNLFLHHG